MKYVALLRGINVSGQKKIKMADLKTLLTKAGLSDVQTYIQSGNIVFSSEKSIHYCTTIIEKCISDNYAFEVSTLVLEQESLPEIIENNPFAKNEESKKLYFCFLLDSPDQEGLEVLMQSDFNDDRFEIVKNVLYLCYHNGAGKSKLTNNAIESKLKVGATSRNWNTVCKLAEM